ncbi:MAG: hypothetical protein QNJ46_35930 [Leptolyngbyaceae cyanobacterium MO_188.B28]|nr:hypothetical protein [Leptolyngbyaceae cyanobacterium MO_188.B28]
MEADQASEAPSAKQINLPDPDPDNITVLTKELPNEPILPWHRFDSPWLEGDEKDKAEAKPNSVSDQTEAEDAVEGEAEANKADADKAETLLVELKEKIEEEIELLEQAEPQAQNAEPAEEVEEIAELARELVSKLEAKKAVKTETSAPAQNKAAEAQLDKIPVGESEDLIEARDEVE